MMDFKDKVGKKNFVRYNFCIFVKNILTFELSILHETENYC